MPNPAYTTFLGNKITSPSPSTTVKVDKPFLITWTNITGPPEYPYITLYLLNSLPATAKSPSDLPRAGRIATVENTGSYRWMVPRSFADSGDYVIETSFDGWMGNYSYSDAFSIMGAGKNPETVPDYYTNVGLSWGNTWQIAVASFAGLGLLAAAGVGYWVIGKRRMAAAKKKREEERKVQEEKLGDAESRENSVDRGV
ncbi:hypothetical protein TWF481_004269 [Arthrobotrys musiformis]|uniref:Yeast cell wall synthesis Kre9/Knh1-like N-terminal domain-containing protein n=1 Tax=Arthrobotrys musiformis TaxID=47236 RepID=A0AAV9WL32_9PEZI